MRVVAARVAFLVCLRASLRSGKRHTKPLLPDRASQAFIDPANSTPFIDLPFSPT